MFSLQLCYLRAPAAPLTHTVLPPCDLVQGLVLSQLEKAVLTFVMEPQGTLLSYILAPNRKIAL